MFVLVSAVRQMHPVVLANLSTMVQLLLRLTKKSLLLRYYTRFSVFLGTSNSCFDTLSSSVWNYSRCGRRHFGSESGAEYSSSTNCHSCKDNQLLYRFQWIKQLRFVSRVKVLHVGVVVSLTWPMSYWYSSGLISFSTLTCALVGALGTTAGLVALSYFFRRVVGEISIDEDTQEVTISSLTFWGNRRNRAFPLTSLIPLSDSGIDSKNTFHRLELCDSKDVYLLNLRHCQIFDEMFFSVVGVPMDPKTADVASKKYTKES